jgi:hypothetical protein
MTHTDEVIDQAQQQFLAKMPMRVKCLIANLAPWKIDLIFRGGFRAGLESSATLPPDFLPPDAPEERQSSD